MDSVRPLAGSDCRPDRLRADRLRHIRSPSRYITKITGLGTTRGQRELRRFRSGTKSRGAAGESDTDGYGALPGSLSVGFEELRPVAKRIADVAAGEAG